MKYVRTENAIYEEDKVTICVDAFSKKEYVDIPINVNTSQLSLIIAEADTIEELCDCFMLEPIMKGLTPIDYKRFTTAKKAKERLKLESTLYGAIWVKDKGLIYVAKLNDKGGIDLI